MANYFLKLHLAVLATTFSVFCVSVVHGMTSSVEACSAAGDDICCRICRRDGSCQLTPCNKQSLVRDVTDSKNSVKSPKDYCTYNKETYNACVKYTRGKDGKCLTSIKQLHCVPIIPVQSSLSSDLSKVTDRHSKKYQFLGSNIAEVNKKFSRIFNVN